MEVLRCPNCGGEMTQVSAGRFRCKYCKKESAINVGINELVFSLNAAARCRSKKDFDGAMEEYERAISLDPECSDAYWGMFLSEYGIEFVQDPYSGKYMPTACHRIQTTPVEKNINFKKAIKLVGSVERRQFEEMGKQIDTVREQLLSMSKNMPAYDVFICYKQNEDGTKTPTKESSWARDIYYELKGLGYKVFYAEQSLADKAGKYEANIYAALNSARIMLVLASSLEHVNAVWVKNEWSRFVKLSKDNPDKSFKVIMRGFEPESLPVALRSQQAIRKDDIAWWDKVRNYIGNVFSKEATGAIDEKAKQRLADLDAMRRNALVARQNKNESLSASEVLWNKKKNDAINKAKTEIEKLRSDKWTSDAVKELKEVVCDFGEEDFECAKLCFLLDCSLYCNELIVDELQLIKYPISLVKPSNDTPDIKRLYKVCTEEEKEYFQQIADMCQDNYQAEIELNKVYEMLKEGMYDRALSAAEDVEAEHPTYERCQEAVLLAKYECKDLYTLCNNYASQIYQNKDCDKAKTVCDSIKEPLVKDFEKCRHALKVKYIYPITFIVLICSFLCFAIGIAVHDIYLGDYEGTLSPADPWAYNLYYLCVALVIIGPVCYILGAALPVLVDKSRRSNLIAAGESFGTNLFPIMNLWFCLTYYNESREESRNILKRYECKTIDELEAMKNAFENAFKDE